MSVVVPALNEALNLSALLPQLPEVHEVVLVDGGSVDGTVAAARRARTDVVVVEQGRAGKGNALVAGFAAVTGDIVVTLDADGSGDPGEIAAYVAALVAGADFAKGSRYVVGGSSGSTPSRRFGNAALGWVFNRLFRSRVSDLCYGYNAFWADLLPDLDLPDPALRADGKRVCGDGFEIVALLDCRMAVVGARVVEVPSVERLRLFGESHLHALADGVRVLRTLVAEWRRARRLRRAGRRALVPMAEADVVEATWAA